MKSAELNDVPSEAFKAMENDCKIYIFDFINDFWNDRADFKSWNESQCVPVPKTGNFSD